MCRVPMLIFVGYVALALAAARAAESPPVATQPPLGTFKMRPELVGQHPRLYFTREDIPEIRRLAKGPRRFFLEAAKRSFGFYAGQDVPSEMPEWKRYLYGFWGLFAMDMLYIVEGDQKYADTAKNWALWLTRDRWWVRDSLAPMDALSGLAITYDILYDQFSESERRAIRESILEGIDFISKRFFVETYWTRDYQNNHMHNRIHGLANGSFAIYGDDPAMDVQKYADLAIAQIRNVAAWLPEDGSQHEGPGYWDFGHHWVVRMVHLAEHVTGEDIVGINPHFTNAHYFRIYMSTPGWQDVFNIGDSGGGTGGSLTSVCRSIAEARDGHATSVLRRWMEVIPQAFYRYGAWGLLWYDETVPARPLEELPLWRFWPDLEMFSIRSSWEDDAVALVFKCGPPGGHKMQRLRGDRWVNVAHDHPDQNHFLLFAYGKMMAEDDGYPKPKWTRSHNTIIVDGKGQTREGGDWQQPFPYEDTGTLRELFLSHDTAYAAGDASRLYEGSEKFIRHVCFVGGRYLIVLDDLVGAGDGEHSFEWRLHKDGQWNQSGPGRFRVSDEDVSLDIRFLAPRAAALSSRFLPAERTARPCLAVSTEARATHFLTVLVPTRAGQPRIEAERMAGEGCMAVAAEGPDGQDLFAVADQPGAFAFGPVRADGAAALVRLRHGSIWQALLARGLSLEVDGRLLLGCSQPANLSLRRDEAGLTVEAEPPYRAAGGRATVLVGGLEADRGYAVSVLGGPVNELRTDDQGVLRLDADLSGRVTVWIEE